MKFCMNIMPLGITLTTNFRISYNEQYQHGSRANLSMVDAARPVYDLVIFFSFEIFKIKNLQKNTCGNCILQIPSLV